MKADILAIAAHPDDVELCCAGTLAKLASLGNRTAILDLTKGEMGTRGTPELRIEEGLIAAKVLGAERFNLGLPDTQLFNTTENQDAIIQAVRNIKPEICFINAPVDRHPDHGHAHKLTLDALFYSGLSKRITHDKNGNKQEPWRPKHIFYYMQDTPFTPHIVFDISDTMEKKIEAILAFNSQFNVPDNDKDPKTYISGIDFFEMIKNRARIYGHQIGVTYGEPFQYHGGPLPYFDLFALLNHKPVR